MRPQTEKAEALAEEEKEFGGRFVETQQLTPEQLRLGDALHRLLAARLTHDEVSEIGPSSPPRDSTVANDTSYKVFRQVADDVSVNLTEKNMSWVSPAKREEVARQQKLAAKAEARRQRKQKQARTSSEEGKGASGSSDSSDSSSDEDNEDRFKAVAVDASFIVSQAETSAARAKAALKEDKEEDAEESEKTSEKEVFNVTKKKDKKSPTKDKGIQKRGRGKKVKKEKVGDRREAKKEKKKRKERRKDKEKGKGKKPDQEQDEVADKIGSKREERQGSKRMAADSDHESGKATKSAKKDKMKGSGKRLKE